MDKTDSALSKILIIDFDMWQNCFTHANRESHDNQNYLSKGVFSLNEYILVLGPISGLNETMLTIINP